MDKIRAGQAADEAEAEAKRQARAQQSTSPAPTNGATGPFDKLDGLAEWADLMPGPYDLEEVKPPEADTLQVPPIRRHICSQPQDTQGQPACRSRVVH
jgi:hypothetical protein